MAQPVAGGHPLGRGRRYAGAKDRGADADMRGPKGDGCLEIGAHPHGQARHPVAFGDFAQEREMQRWVFIHGRDDHQAGNRQIHGPAIGNELIRITGQNAGFLGLFAGIDLDKQIGRGTARLACIGQFPGELWPIEGMDRLKEIQGRFDLIGLQRPEKMQDKTGAIMFTATARLPAGLGLLHAVLAKDALSLIQNRIHPVIGLHLGNGDKRNVITPPSGAGTGGLNPGRDFRKRQWRTPFLLLCPGDRSALGKRKGRARRPAQICHIVLKN